LTSKTGIGPPGGEIKTLVKKQLVAYYKTLWPGKDKGGYRYYILVSIKGTVALDLDGLKMVLMDRT
jgi:hypothetical protein